MKLSLTDVAAATGGLLIGGDTGNVHEVSIDNRAVNAGDLFVCIAGERFDGHNFASQAVQAGAAAILCGRELPLSIPQIIVDDTRAALLELAGYYRRKAGPEIVVGITGSVGKTTTKNMVSAVISEEYCTLSTEGNLNNEIGLPRMILNNWWQEACAAVLEMGMNHFGEISRLSKCAAPTIGLITNIGMSHIGNLGSRKGILKAKLEMLDGMTPGAPLLLNADNDLLATVDETQTCGHPILWYGQTDEKSVCRAANIDQKESSIFFEICYNKKKWPLELPVVGIHNVHNALAAFLCGMEAGITPEQAVEGLQAYVPDNRRLNIIQLPNGVTLIDDCYNASPDSVKAALVVLKNRKSDPPGRKIAVLGDMLEMGEYSSEAHADCGRFLAGQGVDALFAFGEEAAGYIEGAGSTAECFHYTDKSLLARDLSDYISAGDTVLFKASRAMHMEEVIKEISNN